jgi:acetamidase/formamidase
MRTLHDRHLGWDRGLPAVAEVSPGEEIELATVDCFDGQLDRDATPGRVGFGDVAALAARPFLGTVGLAPAAPGPHGVIPPRRVGGNLDCRDVRPGARLLLPVEVEGGLLSVGDAHAAQGDGEVCGTAVEVAATVRLRVELLPGAAPPTPRIEVPALPAGATGRRTVTTGVGPDLEEGAGQAVRAMIEQLVDRHDLAPEDAYALCSVAGHLRIVEVVNAPSWTVGLDLDVSVLDG